MKPLDIFVATSFCIVSAGVTSFVVKATMPKQRTVVDKLAPPPAPVEPPAPKRIATPPPPNVKTVPDPASDAALTRSTTPVAPAIRPAIRPPVQRGYVPPSPPQRYIPPSAPSQSSGVDEFFQPL